MRANRGRVERSLLALFAGKHERGRLPCPPRFAVNWGKGPNCTSPHLPPKHKGSRRPFSRKVSSLQKSTHFDTGEQRKAFLHFGRRPLLHSHYPQSPTATSREPHRSLMEMKGRGGTSPLQSHTKEEREAKDNHFTTAHNSSQHHKNSYQDTGEISVCSLWMHIRSLRMAIQRLWMHVPRLRTKIAVRCVNNCSTLHKQSQHAANRTAPRYGNRLILLEAFTHSRQTAAELCKNASESRSQLPSPPFAKRKESRSTAPGNPFRSKKHLPAQRRKALPIQKKMGLPQGKMRQAHLWGKTSGMLREAVCLQGIKPAEAETNGSGSLSCGQWLAGRRGRTREPR